MSEPTTINKVLVVPNTGDLVNSWGTTAVNPNMTAIDGMFGGFAVVSVSSGTTTLSTPSGGTPSPGAGPNQSQNALIRFSGALSGNASVVFTLPGYYIVENLCTNINSFYVQLTPSGGGNNVAAPPGQKCHVFYDGTNMDFVNMPPPGTFLDLCTNTTPPWIAGCTVLPWLPCLGGTYNFSNYTTLGNQLGATFGGNGVTTFGVPNLQSQGRIPIDQTGVNLVTSGGSGINGASWGASGGSQFLQAHTHTIYGTLNGIPSGGAATNTRGLAPTSGNANETSASTGSGGSQNMPPVVVSGITLIKT